MQRTAGPLNSTLPYSAKLCNDESKEITLSKLFAYEGKRVELYHKNRLYFMTNLLIDKND